MKKDISKIPGLDEKVNLLQRFKNWFWFRKLFLWCWWTLRDGRKQKRKHCHYGFHKLTIGREGHMDSRYDKRMKYVHYLKCRYCDSIWFFKIEDKYKWLQFKHRTKETFSAWLKSLSSAKTDSVMRRR